MQSIMTTLKVNQNIITPLFDDILQKTMRTGAPDIVRHNKQVIDASDSGAFWNKQNGPSLYLEPSVTYNVGGKVKLVEDNDNTLLSTLKGFFQDDTLPEYERSTFQVIGRSDVPMGDWDWPDNIHDTRSVTVNNLNDAYELIKDVAGKRNQTWDVYLTPGGVRADLMSHRMTPQQFADAGLFDELHIDPLYAQLSQSPASYPDLSDYKQINTFNTRVSQKPRPNDFVAYRLGRIGNAPINPYNKRIIDTYHINGIQKALANSDTNPYESVATLLSQQATGLPSSFISPVEQQLDQFIANYKSQLLKR